MLPGTDPARTDPTNTRFTFSSNLPITREATGSSSVVPAPLRKLPRIGLFGAKAFFEMAGWDVGETVAFGWATLQP